MAYLESRRMTDTRIKDYLQNVSSQTLRKDTFLEFVEADRKKMLYVSTLKNTVGFVDGRTLLRWILKK